MAVVVAALFVRVHRSRTSETEDVSTVRIVYPEVYEGPVWITVDAPDVALRAVTISWGAWQRGIDHASADPVTYWFTKGAGGAAGPATVETVVTADPAAEVTSGYGEFVPEGAVDVRDGWVAAS
jgi:hypothetical protein